LQNDSPINRGATIKYNNNSTHPFESLINNFGNITMTL